MIGPYLFEENGRRVTVNGERYRTMLNDLFPAVLENNLEEVWFQQDGVTYQTATLTIDLSKTKFGGEMVQ